MGFNDITKKIIGQLWGMLDNQVILKSDNSHIFYSSEEGKPVLLENVLNEAVKIISLI